jgi:hypothetical protein
MIRHEFIAALGPIIRAWHVAEPLRPLPSWIGLFAGGA